MIAHCYLTNNDYIAPALFIKLIVNNVKFGSIYFQKGTTVHFIINVLLHYAEQREIIFTQHAFYGQVSINQN